MEEKNLRNQLRELDEILAATAAASKASSKEGTYIAHSSATPAKSNEEIVDHVRLQVKYLLFDLEATRRENRYLRDMLERRSNFGEGSD